ncbi:tRNA (adenine(22)-N(1))-methyltransferase TrmK [Paenibacillus sp. HB172176]|uniref:tRNA (adenine(22)-N(1))-methyltransferase n=1 Tax=Paenibacillus sp. HB172176 TaxID=2493690 RepID=UPI00197D09EF|nr:tRNA (adenine(22)-N(1))-methyltransferase TrmK [Paenibacillus sp. HB172176]
MVKLSKRLQGIADYINKGSRAADIGSDHALLPVYLIQNGLCSFAIAGELNDGPFLAAKKQVAAAGQTSKITVRQGDGLQVIEPGEADTVTIAGMGGSLMTGILEAGRIAGKLQGVSQLVLQPNVGEDAVRIWLLQHEWVLTQEMIVEEDGKIYEILVAVPEAVSELTNAEVYDGSILNSGRDQEQQLKLLLRLGPHLLREGNAVLLKKWQSELTKLERIAAQLGESSQPEAALKKAQFREEMNQIKEVLVCLQTDKL